MNLNATSGPKVYISALTVSSELIYSCLIQLLEMWLPCRNVRHKLTTPKKLRTLSLGVVRCAGQAMVGLLNGDKQ